MANKQFINTRNNVVPNSGGDIHAIYVWDTGAKPSSSVVVGDFLYEVSTNILYVWTGAWSPVGRISIDELITGNWTFRGTTTFGDAGGGDVVYFGNGANISSLDGGSVSGNRAWALPDASGTLLVGASGTYTPTLTNVANLAASTAYQCQYMRVGNIVTVSGKVDIDPTSPATLTQLGISLPIASNLGAQEDCAGAAFASGIAAQGAAIRGDATNNRAEMAWISADLTNQAMYFTFTYEVI